MNCDAPRPSLLTIGDIESFAVQYEINPEFGGEWLFGKFCYIVESKQVGDYLLGTSLRDVLLQMSHIFSDSGCRRNPRFDCKNKDELFIQVGSTLYGFDETGYEELAVEEMWAKHDLTPPVEVFDCARIFQFDDESQSRILWRMNPEFGSCEIHESIIQLGTTERVFSELYASLGKLVSRA